MAQTATFRRNGIIRASGAAAAIAIAAAAVLAFTQEPVPGQRGRGPGVLSPIFAALDANRELLTFVSLTGLILIYFIHKHRFSGLLALAGGAAIAGLVYAFFVP